VTTEEAQKLAAKLNAGYHECSAIDLEKRTDTQEVSLVQK